MIFIQIPFLNRRAMAFFPFVFIKTGRERADAVLMNHERIHLRQQLELLFIPFYLFYGIHYLVNLLRFRNHEKAYREIVFEKEAYGNQNNPDYLSGRRIWGFVGYFNS